MSWIRSRLFRFGERGESPWDNGAAGRGAATRGGPTRDTSMQLSPRGVFERYTFSGGPKDTNSYLLVAPATRDAVLIDAAGEADEILRAVQGCRARVRAILLTHGHAGHWNALGRLRDAWGASVGVHLDDAEMLPLSPNFALGDGQRIAFGATGLDVIATPGHTPGSVCFYGDGILFSGDALLAAGPGTTAAPLGDRPLLLRSLRERVFTLPGTTYVFPGHGDPARLAALASTLDEEAPSV